MDIGSSLTRLFGIFPQSVLLAVLVALVAAMPLSAADTLQDCMADATKLTSSKQYEAALDRLEPAVAATIGDPLVEKAKAQIDAVYKEWMDVESKSKRIGLLAALVRVMAKNADLGKALDAEQRLNDEWDPRIQEGLKGGKDDEILALGWSAIHVDSGNARTLGMKAIKAVIAAKLEHANDGVLALMEQFGTKFPQDQHFDAAQEAVAGKGLLVLARKFAQVKDQDQCLRAWAVASKWQLLSDPAEWTKLRVTALESLANQYVQLHATGFARQLLTGALADDILTATSKASLQKIADSIDQQEKKYKAIAILPAVIDRDVTIKALPVSYSLTSGSLHIDGGAKITVEPGVCISGGKIEFNKGTIELQGTVKAPVICEDIEFFNDGMSNSKTVTGQFAALVNCTNTHRGGWSDNLQNLILTNSILQKMEPMHASYYDVYRLDRCTVINSDFDAEVDKSKLTSLEFRDCGITGKALLSLDKANLVRCYAVPLTAWELTLAGDRTQSSVYMDAPWEPRRAEFMDKMRIKGKGAVIVKPSTQPLPNCGAGWSCPSFLLYVSP